jgi:hypothetical protein
LPGKESHAIVTTTLEHENNQYPESEEAKAGNGGNENALYIFHLLLVRSIQQDGYIVGMSQANGEIMRRGNVRRCVKNDWVAGKRIGNVTIANITAYVAAVDSCIAFVQVVAFEDAAMLCVVCCFW